jgi:hypothetical protein
MLAKVLRHQAPERPKANDANERVESGRPI